MTELRDALVRSAAAPAGHPSVADLRAELGRRHRRRRARLAAATSVVVVFGAVGAWAVRPAPDRETVVEVDGGPQLGARLGDGFCEPQLTNAGFRISAPAAGAMPIST